MGKDDELEHWISWYKSLTDVCLAGVAADLGKQEVDTERRILVVEVILNGVNLNGNRVGRCVRDTKRDIRTCDLKIFGVYPTPPMTPRPPALVTAAASSGPAATFMPETAVPLVCHRRGYV